MHFNNLMWSRVQLLYWIQLTTIAGSFFDTSGMGKALSKSIKFGLPVLGLLLTAALTYLITVDADDRDQHKKYITDKSEWMPEDYKKHGRRIGFKTLMFILGGFIVLDAVVIFLKAC